MRSYISDVINSVLQITSDKIEGPSEIMDISLEGDWIVRTTASPDERLKALGVILKEQFGQNIRFEQARVSRHVIIASGQFKLNLPSHSEDRKIVHLYVEPKDLERSAGRSSGKNAAELLHILADRTALPVVDQAQYSDEEKFNIEFYSLGTVKNRAADAAQKEKALRQLLDNVTNQTSLKFRVEAAEVPLWFVKRVD